MSSAVNTSAAPALSRRRSSARPEAAQAIPWPELLQAVMEAPDMATGIRRVDRLLHRLSARVHRLALQDSDARRPIGAERPSAGDLRAFATWQVQLAVPAEPSIRRQGGLLIVPLLRRRQVRGLVAVHDPDRALEEDHLRSLGLGFAELARRSRLSSDLASHRVARRIAERRAESLLDALSDVDTTMADLRTSLTAAGRGQSTRHALATLGVRAEASRRALRAAVLRDRLAPDLPDRLVPALRVVARRYSTHTGVGAEVVVVADPGDVGPARTAALIQLVGDALVRADHDGRACVVTIEVRVERDAVVVTLHDDGTSLAHRDVFGAAAGWRGYPGLRGTIQAIGGTLEVRGSQPHGVVLVARVPLPAGAGGRR